MFRFRRAAFSQQFKSKVDLTLAKAAALRITLNLDGAPITSKSHTHPSHSQPHVGNQPCQLVPIFREYVTGPSVLKTEGVVEILW
jgi:hypothetical protein